MENNLDDARRIMSEPNGIEWHHALTLKIAMKFLDSVEAVIVNPNLPDADGLQAVIGIRARTAKPLLIFSGNDDRQIAELCGTLGADGFISKDSSTTNIILAVRCLKGKAKTAQGTPRSSTAPMNLDATIEAALTDTRHALEKL